MHLVADRNPGAYAVQVPCLACGALVLLADAQIDLDGPAYRAYYHQECVPTDAPRRERDKPWRPTQS